MNILTITTADEETILTVKIRDDVEPDALTIAVLNAIRDIKPEKARKTRSDAGKTRALTPPTE